MTNMALLNMSVALRPRKITEKTVILSLQYKEVVFVIVLFKRNTGHPRKQNLMFYPQEFRKKNTKICDVILKTN